MTVLDEAKLQRLRTEGDQPEPLLRLCAYQPCSKPLVRRDGEERWRFEHRACCNASCANRRAQGSTAPLDLPAEKVCEECSGIMRWEKGVQPSKWEKKRFCSRQCTSRNTIRTASAVRAGVPLAPKVLPECARPGCGQKTKHVKRKYCSHECRNLSRRTPGGDARRAGIKVRKAPRPVVAPVPVERPSPESLLPDPAVVDMDRKRVKAERMLDQGAFPERVAVECGVSVAQVRRWDRGDR